VPAFIKKIATGNLRGSARVILGANPMGHSCARACPVEVLCEGACVLNERDQRPIQIALLQRHATDYALEHAITLFQPGAPNGKQVAIVGAGPAGLSCAQELRRRGYAITVFEAKILDLGVELRTGVVVGRDISFAELEQDFAAVFVAVGLGATRRLGIPGEDLPGVYEGLAFIEHLKTHPYAETRVGRRVAVIGAGNTAIDAVTQAKRLGAERATIVYRRGPEDMPAYEFEYELAKRDGCEFRFHTAPVRIVGTDAVTGNECVRTEPGERGPDGRRRPVEVQGSAHVIQCDMVIKALGQVAREDFARVAGVAVKNGRMVSKKPHVFVGGDCVNGGAEIVNAAAEGIQAAAAIDEFLAVGKQ
jgi:glutamate synthase (NADPH/NADH) small chain